MNRLYYGDNLSVLREHIAGESVDLIYLDPPFNSKRDYNLLFKTPKGQESDAQITAFEDSWHWGEQAEREFGEILKCQNTDVSQLVQALRSFLGENDMMAYLVMMTNRLLELRRVLRPTGSLYLHCDPTASHYLRIVLDAIFGVENFRNEIVWRRTGSHNSARKFGPIHDTIFFYSKSDAYKFNVLVKPYMAGHVVGRYAVQEGSGKYKFTSGGNILTGSGVRTGESGSEWQGFSPTAKRRHWAIPGFLAAQMPADFKEKGVLAKLDALYEAGLVEISDGSAWPTPVRYLGAEDGQPLQDIWAAQPYTEKTVFGTEEIVDADVAWLGTTAPERQGYPTQKPIGLLERIIKASSDEGDIVLDPFCGCGTSVHAAQKLGRQWTGIDITHLAIALIEKRMRSAFRGIAFEVEGTPRDLDGARDLAVRDKYQFQWWACSLISAQPFQGKKKGADGGIDGLIFFQDDKAGAKKIVVSVKGGENVTVAMIRDLAHVVRREKAEIGLFVTLAAPTGPMATEAVKEGFYESPAIKAEFPRIQILTISGLLDGSERPRYPDLAQGGHTFKKAKREEGTSDQRGLF